MAKQATKKRKEGEKDGSRRGGWALWSSYFDEEGERFEEICGRLLIQDGGHMLFEHEHTTSQRHFLTASPGGYDAAVLGFLAANGVQDIWDIEKAADKTETVRLTALDTILRFGQFRAQGGRWRFFLSYPNWNIVERNYYVPPPVLPRVNIVDNFLRDLAIHLRRLGCPVPAELEGELVALGV